MSVYGIFEKLGKSNDSEIATACLAGFKLAFIPLATASDKKATKEQKEYAIFRDLLTEMIALSGYLGITNVVKKNASAPLCSAYYKKKAKLIRSGKIADAAKTITEEDLKLLEKVDKKAIKAVGFDSLNGVLGKPELGGKATAAQIKHVDAVENVVKKIEPLMPKADSLKGFKGGVKKLFSATQEIQRPKDLFTNTKVAVSGLCVYVLALSVIPMVCNAVITPVMKKYKELKAKKPQGANALDINKPQSPIKANAPVKKVNSQPNNNPYQQTTANIGNMRVGM